MNRKSILLTFVVLGWGSAAFAQNLNPVVEVTNTYVREASGIEKPSQLLALPDSVLKFHFDMDYNVRSTPYAGAYEFKPYLVQLRPAPRLSQESSLFLRAGTGYSLHPEVTAIWTPVKTGKMRLNVFGDLASYVGRYRNIALQNDRVYRADGSFRSGMDMRSTAGADMLYFWTGGSLSADLRYKNVYATDISQQNFSNNGVQLQARVQSVPGGRFSYQAGTHVAYTSSANVVGELHSVTDASFGSALGANAFRVGLQVESLSQRNRGSAVDVALLPHYIMTVKGFHIDLGVRLSMLFRTQGFCPRNPGYVFPDVHVSYNILNDAVVLQAAATGGDHLVSYEELLGLNPFMAGSEWHSDNMVERFNLMVGARGKLTSRFHYDLKLGYKHRDNAWTWGWDLATNRPGMGYVDHLKNFYVNAELLYLSDRLDIGSNLDYKYTILPDLTGKEGLLAPPAFTADAHAFYKWGGRIRAGVELDACTAMKSLRGTLPGYADLSLLAELNMTSSLGLWLKVGNLLNQTVQRNPFYAQQGIYATVGVTWSR